MDFATVFRVSLSQDANASVCCHAPHWSLHVKDCYCRASALYKVDAIMLVQGSGQSRHLLHIHRVEELVKAGHLAVLEFHHIDILGFDGLAFDKFGRARYLLSEE